MRSVAATDASAAATALGVHAELEIAEVDDETRGMLEHCAGSDLLVVPPGEVTACLSSFALSSDRSSIAPAPSGPR